MEMRRGYIASPAGGEGRVSVAFHPAKEGGELGVVVLGAGFEEKKSSHRTLVELCRTLSEQGTPSVRFDYRGTGDSTGGDDALTLASAGEDLAAATDSFLAECRVRTLVLLGLRLGCAVAASAAGAARRDAMRLKALLVEPFERGEDYVSDLVRQSGVRRMMTEQGGTRTGSSFREEAKKNGVVDVDGTLMSARLLDELDRFNLVSALFPAGEAPQFDSGCILQVGHRRTVGGKYEELLARIHAREREMPAAGGGLHPQSEGSNPQSAIRNPQSGAGWFARAVVTPQFWLQIEHTESDAFVSAVVEVLKEWETAGDESKDDS